MFVQLLLAPLVQIVLGTVILRRRRGKRQPCPRCKILTAQDACLRCRACPELRDSAIGGMEEHQRDEDVVEHKVGQGITIPQQFCRIVSWVARRAGEGKDCKFNGGLERAAGQSDR